jgi:hypothetical protein
MTLTREDLLSGLAERFGYPKEHAPIVAAKLLHLQPQLRLEFELWWKDGALPTLNAEGYTVERLVREHHLKPMAAILTLDWIMREPARAIEAIREGADSVRPAEG